MNNIFVGNLSFEATKEDVIKLFEPFGTVANVVIMLGKKGKSRGYGFVDMPSDDEKNAAITALQGKEFMWRVLSVSPVIPKEKGAGSKRHEKPHREDRSPRSETTSDAKSKYYSKLDGRPKPWQKKVNKVAKPWEKKDEGSRPYYGKKKEREEGSKYSNKPKISKGFKMMHKVSAATKRRADVI
jgi:RNA recognition motif-containing protein